MAEPPLLAGAVKATLACVLPAVAVAPVGAPGTVDGVTAAEAVEAELVPALSEPPSVYFGSCVGEQRTLPALPEVRLVPDGALPGPGQMLRELGVFAFVSRRL